MLPTVSPTLKDFFSRYGVLCSRFHCYCWNQRSFWYQISTALYQEVCLYHHFPEYIKARSWCWLCSRLYLADSGSAAFEFVLIQLARVFLQLLGSDQDSTWYKRLRRLSTKPWFGPLAILCILRICLECSELAKRKRCSSIRLGNSSFVFAYP